MQTHPQAWTIAPGGPRPDPELVRALARFPTTQLSDASDRVRVVSGGVRKVAGTGEVCGPACTVWTRPGDLLFMIKATELVQSGDVLVVDGAGREDAALMGEIFSALLKRRGCVGAVVDGAVRDLEGIDEVGLPIFARHVYPATDTKEGPGAINVPVLCAGVQVEPGDIVRADVNGVVVIPAGLAVEVLGAAEAVSAREQQWLAETAKGRTLTDVLGMQHLLTSAEPTMPRPALRVTSVTIGTPEPHELAHFYAQLLGWPLTADEPPVASDPDKGGWAQIGPPQGQVGPTLNFEYEQHFTRPVWPSAPGDQTASQHLDIEVADLDVAVEWALARGATLADVQPQDDVRVLFDPDGHPFCLFR